MKVATQFLAKELTYRVPQQSLKISMSKMSTLPQSGFMMEKVRLLLPSAPGKAQ